MKRQCLTCDKLYLSKCYLNPPQLYYGALAEVEAYPSPTLACSEYSHVATKASAYAFSTHSDDTTIVTGDILKMLVTFNTPVALASADANSGFYIACTIGGVARKMKAAVVSENTDQLLFSYTIVATDGGTVLITGDKIEKFGASPATLQWIDDTTNTNDGLKDIRMDGFIWSNIVYAGSGAGSTNCSVDKDPVVDSVTPIADDTYVATDELTLKVTYDEAITITAGTGAATVGYTSGGTAYDLAYDATRTGNAENTDIVFSRAVLQADKVGPMILVDDIVLTGNFTIQDSATKDAQVAYAFSDIDTSGILVYPVATLDAATAPADGTYNAGDVLQITAGYDHPVTVSEGTGTGTIGYVVDATSYDMSYDDTLTAAAGEDEVVFSRVVLQADKTGAVTLVDDIATTGDFAIADASGQAADKTYAFSGITTTGVLVNPIPAIETVTPVGDGTFAADDEITLTVNYDEDITISAGTGTAKVGYTVGEVSYDLDYDSVLTGTAESDEIVFSRTVVLEDESGAITLVDDITLTGDFTIQDSASQDAQLTYAFSGIDTSGIIQDGTA